MHYNILRRVRHMKSYSSREIIDILKKDGWYLYKVSGDHYQFKHERKLGKVTIPHPKKDLPIGTLKSISKQSGVEL
jgi:predicted RNA binding protein YcfA (HicA-like mRNA interferase family)